jgi:membrane protein DedA with SNARE-associated domain
MDFIEFATLFMKTKTVSVVFVFIFFASTAEYFFPPFPGDTILLFGAFLVGRGLLPPHWVFISATLGSFAGSMALYAFGATKGRKYFLKKNHTFFSASRVQSLENTFRRKWGGMIIIINRFTPGFRSFFFVAAGIAKMPAVMVAIYSFTSIVVWNIGIMYIGYRAGLNWKDLRYYLNVYSYTIFTILSVIIAIYAIYWVGKMIMKRRKNSQGKQ